MSAERKHKNSQHTFAKFTPIWTSVFLWQYSHLRLRISLLPGQYICQRRGYIKDSDTLVLSLPHMNTSIPPAMLTSTPTDLTLTLEIEMGPVTIKGIQIKLCSWHKNKAVYPRRRYVQAFGVTFFEILQRSQPVLFLVGQSGSFPRCARVSASVCLHMLLCRLRSCTKHLYYTRRIS